ncbi:MAG: GldG family protein [Candidatus Cloacimonadota bacterium]|nr:GldG family protein [Candidatus Cloacimonadota bacterium]
MKNLDNTLKTILIIAIIIIINLISLQIFTRIDITKGKKYSISKYSKNLVGNLKDKLTIKAFFTPNIPSPYNKLERDVKDKLEEYKAFANRYFQFEFVKDKDKEKFVQEASRYGIPEVRVNAIEKDEAVIKNVNMGLVIMYEDRTETIPVIEGTQNLEYDISAKINKLIKKNLPEVGFLQGHGELDFENKLQNIKKQLEANYELKAINLAENKTALEDAEVLVIAAPKSKIPLDEQYAIDQFIMKGKKVLFMMDNVEADIQTQPPKAEFYPNDMNLWFANYGFKINRDLVYDAQSQNVQVQQVINNRRHISFMRYPFFIQVADFNKTNLIVKNLNPITLFFASSVDTSFAAEKGIRTIKLASSSKRSGLQDGRLNIAAQRNTNLKYAKQNILLAALLTGNFSSYFSDKSLPDSLNIDTSGMIRDGSESRLLAIGNAQFISDDYLSQSNALFFANSIDWMAQEKGLIQIRSKNIVAPKLDDISVGAKSTIKFIIRFLPTILIILFGIIMWQNKKRRYKRFGRFMQ